MTRCPGQDGRSLKVESIKCPNCGYEIEIFSDEMRVRCPNCKLPVFRDLKENSCVFWCQYADQCVGPERIKEINEAREHQSKSA